MISRPFILVVPIVLLAAFAFRSLVQGEVERVVGVHVTHKATHLLDMLKADAQTAEQLHHASSAVAFVTMAETSNVASVHVFGPDGRIVEHDHHNEMPSDASPTHLSHNMSDHAHAHTGHQQSSIRVDEEVLARVAKVRPPGQDELRPLLEGGMEPVLSTGELSSDGGHTDAYGQVSLPAYTASGQFLGIVTFTLGASQIYAAMSHGSALFGVLFSLFGGVLFGIPAIAFWLQKRLAERSAEDIGYLSRHDALTGLLNRQTFSTEVEKEISKGRVEYVGYVDADRFKLINDTYGHSVGDAFLKHIANLLVERLGEDALVARFGGDEFTFALYQQGSKSSETKVEEVNREAAKELTIDGFAIRSSISIGLAKFQPEDSLEHALQRADTALYFAKSQGRNSIALFDKEMGDAAKQRRSLENLLRKASLIESFELAFQPLVDTKSETIIGYEALLRLRNEDGHSIAPSEFIPIAEEIGLIEEIGDWVLFNAMQQIVEFDDEVSVSINLSAEQFKSGKLVGTVAEALEQSGLPPKRLELEVTESVLLEHDAHVGYQIDALKDMGISIAMDDFGTGFSSLSTLWRYGFDRIKIDRSFVQALDEAPERSQQLIDSIILLGARMGMSITAEGIETDAQRSLLAKLGCDVLQGYYYGKPQPLEDQSSGRRVGALP